MAVDPELMAILDQAVRAQDRARTAKAYNRTDALRRANRAEFERRLHERLSATQHSVRIALNDDPLDAMRFRHWFLYMRFTPPPSCIAEWRRLIDLDILNKQELEGG